MSEIEKEINKLAADFLKELADRQGNDGCNDWDFPSHWTKEMKEDFVRGYHRYNNSADDFDPDFITLPNFAVASYLAYILRGRT